MVILTDNCRPKNTILFIAIFLMMSIHFSKIIKAGDRNREFNFNRTNRTNVQQYNVNVPDERGNRIFFTMYQEGGVWKIAPDVLPAWVAVIEEELGKAIDEENKAEVVKEGRSR
jgi:hypothetical protein